MPVESVHLPCFIPPAALLDHWQGHRRLTRRVIESFPEDRLFSQQSQCVRSAPWLSKS